MRQQRTQRDTIPIAVMLEQGMFVSIKNEHGLPAYFIQSASSK